MASKCMPDSQRIASSITMGVSWGARRRRSFRLILAACRYAGRYEPAFVVFALATRLSSLLCIWLPVLETSNRDASGLEPSAARAS